jgi:hypothetical protein
MKLFLSIGVSLLFLSSAYSADIVVNGSGLTGTYNTISAAVQAANPGDKILVSNQAFPYQEDTLFINKGVSILPYSDITHIDFEGDIMITLDSVSELTLIGFNSDDTDILSVFNDTSRNSLSTINIVDCWFSDINLDQPKTSLYLSYSTVDYVYFSHGNLIGNDIDNGIQVGIHNRSYSYNSSTNTYSVNKASFINNSYNYLSYQSYNPTMCQLFDYSVDFGNVSVYSDTINIIANEIMNDGVAILSKEFPVHIYNNNGNFKIKCYLICPPSKGINRIINNTLWGSNQPYPITFMLAYCGSSTPTHNIEHINLHILNNSMSNGYKLFFDSPQNNPLNEGYMPILSSGISSYNSGYGDSYYFEQNSSFQTYSLGSSYGSNPQNNTVLQLGPGGNSGKNPSPEFLNLDLSPNTRGSEGGSHAFINYNPSGTAGFNTMTGSKARITYLNLPTQIFDPANIQIKAKAVHGN